MVISQGEVWWADLPEPTGSGPGLRRPVRLAPELLEERLARRWMIAKPEYKLRATGLLRVAAGLEDPSAVERFR